MIPWQQQTQKGFVKFILLLILFILILSYFNIDLRAIVESPQTQQNISYVKELTINTWNAWLKPLWDNYLSKPILYFWQNIFIEVLWKSFLQGINALRDGNFNSASIWNYLDTRRPSNYWHNIATSAP
ncbi:MAG: hypothetical protein HYT28_02155 [Parcubacteria group bacterium]|nr:hypothetical protein [Parcubacteria group bacterium]